MFVESYRLLLLTLDPLSLSFAGRSGIAACEAFERATRRYPRPAFDITSTTIQGRLVPVHEQVVWQSPFCRLLHFKRDIETVRERVDPPLLLVAPMSGHFATLLRGTVQSFLPNHEVYVTDWQDARAVPLTDGHFDLDDYIETMAAIFRFFSGNIHVFAVCQPAVPVLAATALMEAAADPAVPLTLMLAGGPVDTRISPTAINRLAEERGVDWFSRNVITEVPWPAPGHGRLVYPGFLQLSGFMMMNLDRHVQAHKEMFMHLASGDGDSAQKHRTFYDEYLAVMDLTAEFFLQTVDTVFVRHALPQGRMTSRNRQIALAAIRRPALMTIEGENDNITGRGQCRAALKHCVNIPADRKDHFECPGVGHYGIFNGSRFKAQVVPRMAEFMRAHPHHP
jgi:poly(3-hydroxybutyrate) depolymerase